jgi:beta-N-acetylhexosaminidase
VILLATVAVILVTTAAFSQSQRKTTSKAKAISKAAAQAKTRPAPAPAASPTGPVQQWMQSLTLREKIAQLVVVPFYGDPMHTSSREYRQLRDLVEKQGVGGLIVINRVRFGAVGRAEPNALAAFLNRMQRAAKVPLLVGGDFERGASMRMSSTVPLPHAMAFAATGNLEDTRFAGALTAKEARAVGVNWVFAPVADVNNNPLNPIINIRSYGEDPQQVAEHVEAFLDGMHSNPRYPVLSTVKHFPGHGDTEVDSHIDLPVVTADRARMDAVELVPFRAAIQAKVDAVMTAHLAVPALAPDNAPATLAPEVLDGLLRKELGFQGLIVTDALNMGAIVKRHGPRDAPVRALKAGADVLLMPPDPVAAINAVYKAVQSGEISRKRIDESVRRVLIAKSRLGLHRHRLVELNRVNEILQDPDDMARAEMIAARAVTMLKNQNNVVPLKDPAGSSYFVLLESRTSTRGQDLAEALRARVPDAGIDFVDPQMPAEALQKLLDRVPPQGTVVVTAFVSAAAYRGNVALAANLNSFVQKLTESGRRVVLVSLGNPYLLRDFPEVDAYLTTFSTATPAETATVKALLGEVAIQGKLPVSIPDVAPLGSGLTTPGREQQ